MKWVVYILAALVVGKFIAEDHAFKAATTSALVDAFRNEALQACQQRGPAYAAVSLPRFWTQPSAIHVEIERDFLAMMAAGLASMGFGVDPPSPRLVVVPADRHSQMTCIYDLATRRARIEKT